MRQGKAKTYASAMVKVLDGVSAKEAAKRVSILKRVLYKRGDSKHISKILQEFAKAWKDRNGKVATVLTVEPLADKTGEQFEKALSKKRYIMEEKIDPAAIGGVALFLGSDYVIDGTIKGKLQRLARRLQR